MCVCVCVCARAWRITHHSDEVLERLSLNGESTHFLLVPLHHEGRRLEVQLALTQAQLNTAKHTDSKEVVGDGACKLGMCM